MGMFDSVIITCPDCGKDIEFQSKGGPCEMISITNLSNVPMDIASDLDHHADCSCGVTCEIGVPTTVAICTQFSRW